MFMLVLKFVYNIINLVTIIILILSIFNYIIDKIIIKNKICLNLMNIFI